MCKLWQGEEDSNCLKKCSACLSVKYCSRECQAAHRPQHKKECKKRAAELYDEKLFKKVEPDPEACPICMAAMPFEDNACCFKPCGKMICTGCIYAMTVNQMKRGKRQYEDNICPFCRTPPCKSVKEEIRLLKKLLDTGNGGAYKQLADYYHRGVSGLSQDYQKSNELLLKAGELGSTNAYYNLGQVYRVGSGGGQIDLKKATYYYELSAMGGEIMARHNLGCMEAKAGNHDRAFKHFIMAAKAGCDGSLDMVKKGYMHGDVTKDEYANTLRAYQKSNNEMKSDMRDKAATIMHQNEN